VYASVAALVVKFVAVIPASLVECVVAAAQADFGVYAAVNRASGAVIQVSLGAGQAVLKIQLAQINSDITPGDY
jgi:hypothetical protein